MRIPTLVKKIAVILIILGITFVVPMVLSNLLGSQTSRSTTDQTAVETDNESGPGLKIISLPPHTVKADQIYQYKVNVEYNGTGVVSYQIIQKPSWLGWDEEKSLFTGQPTNQDVGVATVKFVASDGDLVDEQVFDIEVQSNLAQTEQVEGVIAQPNLNSDTKVNATNTEGKDVKGSQTWQDPFHPGSGVKGEYTAAGGSTLPDSALSPLGFLAIGIALIALGIVFPFLYAKLATENKTVYKLSNGLQIVVTERKSKVKTPK